MKSHDGPRLEDFHTAYANGDYVLYNITDNASHRSSFNSARRELIAALIKNLSDRFVDTDLLSAFKMIYPRRYPTSTSVSKGAETQFGET